MRRILHAPPEAAKANFLVLVSELVECRTETGKKLILKNVKEKFV